MTRHLIARCRGKNKKTCSPPSGARHLVRGVHDVQGFRFNADFTRVTKRVVGKEGAHPRKREGMDGFLRVLRWGCRGPLFPSGLLCAASSCERYMLSPCKSEVVLPRGGSCSASDLSMRLAGLAAFGCVFFFFFLKVRYQHCKLQHLMKNNPVLQLPWKSRRIWRQRAPLSHMAKISGLGNKCPFKTGHSLSIYSNPHHS